MENLSEEKLKKDLKANARAIGLTSGATEIFIREIMKNLKKTLKTRQIITEKDLDRLLIKEIKKYSADLAYVYENRDKII